MVIYVPPKYDETDSPLIFLAGPIQGAERWQNKAAEYLSSYVQFNIASPRYIGEDEKIIGDFYPQEKPHSQVDWETYHLDKAGKNGSIIFWLARENQHFCNRAFAQTSRFELGEWKERHLNQKAKILVGIEDGFSGKGYLEHRLRCSGIPVLSNLYNLCEKAAESCLNTKA